MILLLIFIFAMLGSVLSVGLAAVVLVARSKRGVSFTHYLIPYAIGTLLGAAFLGMLPRVLELLPSQNAFACVLGGIVLFFLLEKFALWRHCHEEPCEVHARAGTLILAGDSLHNFVDGVAIAAAFAVSVPLGVATSLAVIAHEVPQEVGDFAILLESGYSRRHALLYNGISSLFTLPGALLTYYLLPVIQWMVPYLLSLSAASFIYIALADLVAGRRSTGGLGSLARELSLMALGIATIYTVKVSLGK